MSEVQTPVPESAAMQVLPISMMQSESITEIAAALSKVQGTLENAVKDTQGYGYKYADLAQILSIVKKPLADNDLAIVQQTQYIDGGTMKANQAKDEVWQDTLKDEKGEEVEVEGQPVSKQVKAQEHKGRDGKDYFPVLVTTIVHKSGQWMRGYFPFRIDDSMKGNTYMQKLGSSMTYARRYTLAAMLGITQEDDDAAPVSAPAFKSYKRG